MNFLLPSHDAETRRRKRRIAVSACAVASVLLLIAFPGRTAFRTAHSRKLLAEAEAYLAQNRHAEAVASARRALAKGGDETAASRVVLRALGSQGNPESVSWWLRLANRPGLGASDHRELLRWATAWRLAELADQQWSFLQNEKPFSPETIRTAADYFALKGDWHKASLFARAALDANPHDPSLRNLLGRILVEGGSERDQSIGIRLLMEQTARTDRAGLDALRQLGKAELASLEASQCAALLAVHPLRQNADILNVAAFEMRVKPYRREEIALNAVNRFRAEGGSVADVCRWLREVRLASLVPKCVAIDQVIPSPDSLSAYADALGELNRWEDLDKILERPDLPLRSVELALYRARTARSLRQSRVEMLRWEQAVSAAGANPQDLLRVADYARRIGARNAAEASCRRLIALGPAVARHGYAELLKVYEDVPEESFAILQEMSAVYPKDEAVANDLAYVSLLLGRAGPEKALLEEMSRRFPNDFAFRATLALAELRSGNGSKARQILESTGSSWRDWLPYQQAIYAAACFACGERQIAEEVKRSVPLEKLKPLERELVASIL